MDHDSKNKHRISDARWRDSVTRCYNLLRQCSYADPEATRMQVLKLTLEQIEQMESQVSDQGFLEQVKSVFDQGETLAAQRFQQQEGQE